MRKITATILSDSDKVDMPKFNIEIIWTSIFEWHVVMCGSKIGDLKEMS